jgi:AcrR family transcriptional regulator
MARQVRSEATRRKILDAAVDVFTEVGFAAADRGAIIERTGMTKGAFYHHFDSMESLASAIIEDGSNLVVSELGALSDSFSPALENILHGTFVTADLFATNKVVRTAEQLTLAFGKFNDNVGTAYTAYAAWIEAMTVEARRAIAEGDIREELDPLMVSESIIGATFGARMMGQTGDGNDLVRRLTQMWELLFPAIVTEASLGYYREFLAREALRHVEHDGSS